MCSTEGSLCGRQAEETNLPLTQAAANTGCSHVHVCGGREMLSLLLTFLGEESASCQLQEAGSNLWGKLLHRAVSKPAVAEGCSWSGCEQ